MKLWCPRIVWVSSGDDAVSAGAAWAGGEVKVWEINALFCQLVNILGFDIGISSTPKIVEAYVIGNKDNKVGGWTTLSRFGGGFSTGKKNSDDEQYGAVFHVFGFKM